VPDRSPIGQKKDALDDIGNITPGKYRTSEVGRISDKSSGV
jgi:hypothetical protein